MPREELSQITLARLPELGIPLDVLATVELIDVIWLKRGAPQILCAFEIEQSTSIYSGILRMKDLARSLSEHDGRFYLLSGCARGPRTRGAGHMTRPSINDRDVRFRLG